MVSPGSPDVRGSSIAKRLVLTFVAVTVLSTCLTVLFLGMRDVMEIGGACGSGGPYVPVQPCPEGTWLVPVSILTGVVAAMVTAAVTSGYVRGMALLAWPALFLSLGWNFLEYGLSPPDGSSVAVGWLVCGVLFVVMGATPLLFVLWAALDRRKWRRKNAPITPDAVHVEGS